MKTTREQLLEMYQLLLDSFGPQHWWPGETPFEVAVGAILTQNTSWTNVEKAIANLKAAGCLDAARLHEIGTEQLETLVRPAGYFRVKAKRLKNFIDWLCNEYAGDLRNPEPVNTSRLRGELLSISGVGPETADSILLYALGRPIFVVDAYTARVMVRHGLIAPEELDYHQLQDLFQSNLEPDVALFNEYHALLVHVGKDFCKPTPRCPACPLEPLPHAFGVEAG
jgi:endonuclease-3 related protein